MAGLIRREDIAQVREATRIEEIVGQHVTLKTSGVGSLKGLCPFHDERTPSFQVRPQTGLWHCFGCGEGGDAISFVQKIDHLEFTEAVEYLAEKAGVTLHYEQGGPRKSGEQPGRRQRLIEAHRIAEEFYASQLATDEASVARQFLQERGFDAAAAITFGIGYSPAQWDGLTRLLRSQGFTDEELTKSGLAISGNRGLYDRFRGRLMWPIRDLTGATIGFGARKLDQDPQSPKYLNTPETPIYHKSKVLYGIDLAKKAIAKERRVVVVEGYTDVMAAHLAGEVTAVATCGTAFGSDHVQLLRRLLGDNAHPAAGVVLSSGKPFGGEIIFTFDGDEAGKNAARKVYVEDQKFAAQTFVAIEPHGWDPCDLRMKRGDEAVRALVASRVPLFEFVIRSLISQVDTDTAEGRVAAIRLAAPVIAGIKDVALRAEYTRRTAGWIGADLTTMTNAVRSGGQGGQAAEPRPVEQYANDPVAKAERLALAALLQHPLAMVGSGYENLSEDAFTVPIHRTLHELIEAEGGLTAYLECLETAEEQSGTGDKSIEQATRQWLQRLSDSADSLVQGAMRALAVQPLPTDPETAERDYAMGVMRSVVRRDVTRQIADVRRRLQRLEQSDPHYQETFEKLVQLEQLKRQYSDVV